MLNPVQFLRTPEYFWRPAQALRRFRRIWHPREEVEVVALPWGAEVQVRTNENIGASIYYYGIFDKVVPEAIARLTDPGEWAIEVGANIGQNCSLMALKTGPNGHVLAFEPHPEVFVELQKNSARWKRERMGQLRLENVALGRTQGEAWLRNGAEFANNRGCASLEPDWPANGESFKVKLCRLDDYIPSTLRIGVCKIDVEGHELAVLEGAQNALSKKSVRDIVYEDFGAQPSPVMRLLQAHGFKLFRLMSHWLKPALESVETNEHGRGWFSHNYLATLEPERARARFKKPGWVCLFGA